jgi:riboflavin synthase
MFTGIVQGVYKIADVETAKGLKRIKVSVGAELLHGLKIGASVAVDGVCLTVATLTDDFVIFDVIQETLDKTTLKHLQKGMSVNIERAAKFGDEVGGHLVSGHIFDTAEILDVTNSENNTIITFAAKPVWAKYLFPKGYIAIDGISLTLANISEDLTFTVHLIPETRRATTLGQKKPGQLVNIEVDAQIQAIVDTIERIDGRSPLYQRPA